MIVSETQKDYLKRAEYSIERNELNEAAKIIHHVISDQDISEGREELDERWERVWNKVKNSAKRIMPPTGIERIEAAIENIASIDENLWQVNLAEEQPLTVLLGAGASKPSPSNIPVVAEFLPELWRRARKLDREDLNNLAKWCGKNNISNIEDLLTAAQIANFTTKSSGILTLLYYFLYSRSEPEFPHFLYSERSVIPRPTFRPPTSDVSAIALLQDTLQILFSLLTEPMILAEPNSGHRAISELISKHINTTIITTNYDGCIDQAIKEKGIPYEYLIGQKESNNNETAKLIKMHGSINWFHCESCQEMFRYNLSDIKEAYKKNKLGYPVIQICKNCGGLARPMIVPPLSLKFFMFPPLAGLWDKAQIAFQNANIILVVGYSFSEADTYITRMIHRAMGADLTKQLIIVDTDRSLVNSVTEKLSAHIDNFNRKRVIRAIESCDSLLPRLCKSLIVPKKQVSTMKSRTK